MIYDDYINYTNEYRAKYGHDTVVFLQVGDFFELYAVQNEEESAGADIFRIGDLCNLQVTRKNKSLPENSRSNPYMAGFPLPIVQKHVQTLTQHNYTVVIVRQVTPPPNVRREVTEIISPSTNVQTPSTDGNFLLSLYCCTLNHLFAIGISGVDVTTGHTFAYEAYSSRNDPSFALDEMYRLVTTYAPKEVVVFGESCTRDHQHEVMQLFQGSNHCVHFRWQDCTKLYQKCAYQNEVLKKAFPSSKTKAGLMSFIEACHLERFELARTSFVYMIQFAYEHCEKLVEGLQIPDILQPLNKLTLEYNSSLQLNLVSNMPGEKSLLNILNRCGTAFGSRMFKQRLLQPITDASELEHRFDLISQFDTTEKVSKIHKQLSQIQDLERFARRMVIGTFSPLDWYCMHTSLCHAQSVRKELHYESCNVDDLIKSYENILDINECSKFLLQDIKSNVFKAGVHPHLDALNTEYTSSYNMLLKLAQDITSYDSTGGDACLCRVECNERDGYYLATTKKRWDTAKQKAAKGILDDFEVKPISASSSSVRVTSANIQRFSDSILEAQRKLATLVTAEFKIFAAQWMRRYEDELSKCVQWLAETDVACTSAKNALEYGYTRPQIQHDEKEAYIKCKQMRHPIIERLTPHLDYVTNDIELGGDAQFKSVLLFGINASGKSSFMKAIGLNVIMAQAGMYVPCASMTLAPYRHLFTRISGADNIYRGMSSFTVEMSELSNILHRCDDKSLVLGDELCAGTESVSGLAIVSAGIEHLSKRKASFVFATHLHELTDIPIVSSIPNIRIAHMHITLDSETGKISYGRKLVDGQGSRVYGLEVCSALGLPDDFLKSANKVRRYLHDVPSNLVNPSTSRYNANVVVDKCKVCGDKATETHHIRYQRDASDGAVELGVGVHRPSNLVPLCESCHLKEHHGTLKILGYSQTSTGVELKCEVIESNEKAPTSQKCTVKEHLRYTTRGWKMKTKGGAWRSTTDASALKKLKALLGQGIDCLEEWKDSLYDPFL